LFSRAFSRSPGDARRHASGSNGASGELVIIQAGENDEPHRLFHERGQREVSKAGVAGRHDVYSRRADQIARRTPGKSEMSLRRERRGRLGRGIDFHVSLKIEKRETYPTP